MLPSRRLEHPESSLLLLAELFISLMLEVCIMCLSPTLSSPCSTAGTAVSRWSVWLTLVIQGLTAQQRVFLPCLANVKWADVVAVLRPSGGACILMNLRQVPPSPAAGSSASEVAAEAAWPRVTALLMAGRKVSSCRPRGILCFPGGQELG